MTLTRSLFNKPIGSAPYTSPNSARHTFPVRVDLDSLPHAPIRSFLQQERLDTGRLIYAALFFHWANLSWDLAAVECVVVPEDAERNSVVIDDLLSLMAGAECRDLGKIWNATLEVMTHLMEVAGDHHVGCVKSWTRGVAHIVAPRKVQPHDVTTFLRTIKTDRAAAGAILEPNRDNLRIGLALCVAAIGVISVTHGDTPDVTYQDQLRKLESRGASVAGRSRLQIAESCERCS